MPSAAGPAECFFKHVATCRLVGEAATRGSCPAARRVQARRRAGKQPKRSVAQRGTTLTWVDSSRVGDSTSASGKALREPRRGW